MMRAIQMGAPEALQREIARDFEHNVADEEDAGADSKDSRRKAEIGVHGERGIADIHPVEEIHGVAEDEKGNEPACDLGDRRLLCRLSTHRRFPLAPTAPKRGPQMNDRLTSGKGEKTAPRQPSTRGWSILPPAD
jgi:hypothetical protein